jgi:exonuclease 3'-5' domain-containing protein 1
MPARTQPASLPPNYELCNTRRHVQRALSILSSFPLVILDCEGKNLGQSDGALSLLCLGTPVADDSQHIFVFDMCTLTRCPRSRGALASFLERGPIKIVWDGRMDAIEIFAALGIPLTSVIDLQVVEVVARGAVLGEQDLEREERLALHQFGYRFVDENRAVMRGLHVVRGLQNCIEFYHPDLRIEKDRVCPSSVHSARQRTHRADGQTLSWRCTRLARVTAGWSVRFRRTCCSTPRTTSG